MRSVAGHAGLPVAVVCGCESRQRPAVGVRRGTATARPASGSGKPSHVSPGWRRGQRLGGVQVGGGVEGHGAEQRQQNVDLLVRPGAAQQRAHETGPVAEVQCDERGLGRQQHAASGERPGGGLRVQQCREFGEEQFDAEFRELQKRDRSRLDRAGAGSSPRDGPVEAVPLLARDHRVGESLQRRDGVERTQPGGDALARRRPARAVWAPRPPAGQGSRRCRPRPGHPSAPRRAAAVTAAEQGRELRIRRQGGSAVL